MHHLITAAKSRATSARAALAKWNQLRDNVDGTGELQRELAAETNPVRRDRLRAELMEKRNAVQREAKQLRGSVRTELLSGLEALQEYVIGPKAGTPELAMASELYLPMARREGVHEAATLAARAGDHAGIQALRRAAPVLAREAMGPGPVDEAELGRRTRQLEEAVIQAIRDSAAPETEAAQAWELWDQLGQLGLEHRLNHELVDLLATDAPSQAVSDARIAAGLVEQRRTGAPEREPVASVVVPHASVGTSWSWASERGGDR